MTRQVGRFTVEKPLIASPIFSAGLLASPFGQVQDVAIGAGSYPPISRVGEAIFAGCPAELGSRPITAMISPGRPRPLTRA